MAAVAGAARRDEGSRFGPDSPDVDRCANLAFCRSLPQKIAAFCKSGDRGFGMVDHAQARQAMVDRQVRPHDVTDLRIIAALLDVPRERFFPPAQRALAYLDAEVPVAGPRALLKPMVFAKLLQAAAIGENERVLDVGCATGYSSAVLAELAGSVIALEEDPALVRSASEMLAELGAAHVSVVTGPLTDGWPKGAPYDAILIEGASEIVPDALLAQLK